jgi:short subunit dehydrogenase
MTALYNHASSRAFLPLLRHSNGAIVNNLSLAALAPLPVIPGYSISKAAASNMTQSLRALLYAPSDARSRWDCDPPRSLSRCWTAEMQVVTSTSREFDDWVETEWRETVRRSASEKPCGFKPGSEGEPGRGPMERKVVWFLRPPC